MRNITVAVDEEENLRAWLRAAELGTSVSGLVRGYLRSIASQGSDFGLRLTDERELRAGVENFSGADRLDRNQTHERSRG